MKIVTAAEMREIDRLTTEQYGVPSLTLMENAGTAVAEFAQKHFDFETVCVVCGKGNNGGDGFVAARKLHEAGKRVSVIILATAADELRGDAAGMFKKFSIRPLWVNAEEQFSQAEVQNALRSDLIVDAILGTGFKPPIKGIAEKAIEFINAGSGFVVAVDLPSGLDADATEPLSSNSRFVHADGVISFTAPKQILLSEQLTQGPIAIASIGSPVELIDEIARLRESVLSFSEAGAIFPVRDPESHKGIYGHILVIGGSRGKAGAAAMAGLAALRTGAGLVTVASPESVQPTVAAFAPELMTEPLPETSEGTISTRAIPVLTRLIEGKSCLAAGPGLSRNQETAGMMRELLRISSIPMVLDADGLNAFEGHTHELRGEVAAIAGPHRRTLVLTPHPGEMARITGKTVSQIQEHRTEIALETAAACTAIAVLKGHRTVVAAEGAVMINMTGNPGMAKGGSGDVLTGMVAACLAREFKGAFQPSPVFRVASAVLLHGLAGDVARDLAGEDSMIASDMINGIGEAITICRQQGDQRFAYLQR